MKLTPNYHMLRHLQIVLTNIYLNFKFSEPALE